MSLRIVTLFFLSYMIMAQATPATTATTTITDEVNIDTLFQDSSYDYGLDLKPKIVTKTLEKSLNDIQTGLYQQIFNLASEVETDTDMVIFSVELTDSENKVQVEVIKVSNIIYVRVTHKRSVHKGYIMESSQDGSSIFELNAECKFPEQPVVADIPVQICTLMANQVSDISYKIQNVQDKLVGDVLHCLYDIIKTQKDSIEAQCTKHALEDNWVKMTGQ